MHKLQMLLAGASLLWATVKLFILRTLAFAVMCAAMWVSFKSQHALFLSWGVDTQAATIVPLAADALAAICSIALHMGLSRGGKWTAAVILAISGGASGTANFLSGADLRAGVVHLSAVVFYLLAEVVTSGLQKKPTPVEPKPVMVKVLVTEAEKAARKRAGYRDMTASEKAAWTKQYRERVSRKAPTSPGRVPVSAPSAEVVEQLVG